MNPLKKEALGFKHPFYPGKAGVQGGHHSMEKLWRGVSKNVSVVPRVRSEKELEEAIKNRSSTMYEANLLTALMAMSNDNGRNGWVA